MSEIKFTNYDKKDDLEQKIIYELLKADGWINEGDTVVSGEVTNKGLSSVFCKIACGAKTAVAIVACSGNPICIAGAVISGAKCINDCG